MKCIYIWQLLKCTLNNTYICIMYFPVCGFVCVKNKNEITKEKKMYTKSLYKVYFHILPNAQ